MQQNVAALVADFTAVERLAHGTPFSFVLALLSFQVENDSFFLLVLLFSWNSGRLWWGAFPNFADVKGPSGLLKCASERSPQVSTSSNVSPCTFAPFRLRWSSELLPRRRSHQDGSDDARGPESWGGR